MTRYCFALTLRRDAGFLGRALATAVLITAATTASLSAVDSELLLDAIQSIRAPELLSHVKTLADDSFEGRETGRRGGRAAAEYLRKHFHAVGLRGAGGDGGYDQSFGDGYHNVLGLLPGSDPERKQEVIVVAAHYDHVGYGSRTTSRGPIGYIHNGADDNASGVAGVLEIADACLRLATPPRRSILFALWDGEEKGLAGSRHFMSSPPAPLARVVLVVNLDMIGRMRHERLVVFGSRTGTGLRRLVAEQNHTPQLLLDFDWELKANSDHYSFFTHGVPVLLFHTGIHDDLHRPSDDVDRLDPDGMERAARLVFNVTYALADERQICPFRAASRSESPADRNRLERALPPRPPRLGVRWQSPAPDGAVVLTSVTPGSAADRAGLLPGDRPLEIGGHRIRDGEQLRLELLAARSPVSVLVHRAENAQPLELRVELAGPPSRLGISWREDDAEPGTVILTRVIPGSAGFRAGLQPGDRIYAVAGHPFADTQGLLGLVTTLPSPLELTVERMGRIRTATLDVPPPQTNLISL